MMTDSQVAVPRGAATPKHRAPGPVAAIAQRTKAPRLGSVVAATAAVVALVVVAAVALLALASHSGGTPAPGISTANAEASPTAPSIGKRVATTPEGVLELLDQLVKPMRLSHAAKGSDGRLRVQAYLDDGQGPGMVRVSVRAAPTRATSEPCGPPDPCGATCETLPNGARVTIRTVADNCAQNIQVTVDAPNGTSIDVDIASCLEFDGTTNPVGRLALSADQAVAIAADSRWGRTMDAALVAAGRRHFPQLRAVALPDGSADPASTDGPAAGAGAVDSARAPVTESGLQWEDVNGDAAKDYCRRLPPEDPHSGRVACTLSTRTGFGRTIESPVLDWGPKVGRDWEDFNGDNRKDFCRRVGTPNGHTGRVACTLSTGDGFGQTITSADLDVGADLGWAWDDVNNDNRADYCRRLSDSRGSTGRIACTLSTGTGFGTTITSAPIDLGRDAGWEWEDVNSDNQEDYCRQLTGGSRAAGRIACTLSTGTGFGATITSAPLDLGLPAGQDWEDMNGDDKSDYCRRLSEPAGAGRVACTLSNDRGFGATLTSPQLNLGADVATAWEDANGDKGTDYCRRVGAATDSPHVACTLSTPAGFGATISSPILDLGRNAGAEWADVNADHKKDYCRRTGTTPGVDTRVACTLSTGTGFGDTVRSAPLDWGLDD